MCSRYTHRAKKFREEPRQSWSSLHRARAVCVQYLNTVQFLRTLWSGIPVFVFVCVVCCRSVNFPPPSPSHSCARHSLTACYSRVAASPRPPPLLPRERDFSCVTDIVCGGRCFFARNSGKFRGYLRCAASQTVREGKNATLYSVRCSDPPPPRGPRARGTSEGRGRHNEMPPGISTGCLLPWSRRFHGWFSSHPSS